MIRWELESSKENWAVEGKSCVVCSRQLPPSEPYRLSEVGPLEVGPFEVGLHEVGPLKVGSLEVRLLEVSPLKVNAVDLSRLFQFLLPV